MANDIEIIQQKSIDGFVTNNRRRAIEAIKLHKKHQERISEIRSSLEYKKQTPIDFLDLVYMFEKVARSWADIADLVKPIYNE